jgi:rod shape-determining protein MreC
MAAIRTQREIRQRAPWWLAGLLFANFALMSYDARDGATKQRMVRVWAQTIAYPVQRATAFIGGHAAAVFRGVGNMRRASAENEQLRQQVVQMGAELRDTRDKAAEADRLRALLGLKLPDSYATMPARVIARDPSSWFNTITIDKGSLAGIENNMPVVSAGGIVGRTISTGPLSAQVMLITDEKSGAGAVVARLDTAQTFGAIKGMGDNGLLEMRYVSALEKVAVGDTVETTGQDAIYPARLTVGSVMEVKAGSATQMQMIHIKPGADLDRLEEVVVLLYHAPPRSEAEQAPPSADKSADKKVEKKKASGKQ